MHDHNDDSNDRGNERADYNDVHNRNQYPLKYQIRKKFVICQLSVIWTETINRNILHNESGGRKS